jgi:PP-loop superfamily ATP-utilizing enzyme
MTLLQLPAEIADLVRRGALFVVNHSGGKDSTLRAARPIGNRVRAIAVTDGAYSGPTTLAR